MSKILVHACRVIALGLILSSMVILGIYSHTACSITTYEGETADCPAKDECQSIMVMSLINTASVSYTYVCPWYTRDTALGYLGLIISLSFLGVSFAAFATGNLKTGIMSILNGWLSVLFLLITVILMVVDLFGKPLPMSAQGFGVVMLFSRVSHLINLLLILGSLVFVFCLTIHDMRLRKRNVKDYEMNIQRNNHIHLDVSDNGASANTSQIGGRSMVQ